MDCRGLPSSECSLGSFQPHFHQQTFSDGRSEPILIQIHLGLMERGPIIKTSPFCANSYLSFQVEDQQNGTLCWIRGRLRQEECPSVQRTSGAGGNVVNQDAAVGRSGPKPEVETAALSWHLIWKQFLICTNSKLHPCRNGNCSKSSRYSVIFTWKTCSSRMIIV
jgi:hypothetical protein